MIRERNQWLDIAKGITIILMVLGHSSIPQTISHFIYAFHMPLFFVASGWVTQFNKYDIRQFTTHKIRTLLLPFVIYSAIVLSLTISVLHQYDLVFWVRFGWGGYALWFVPVLFVALIISRLIYGLENRIIRMISVLIFFMGGAILSYNKISLPWNFSAVPYAVVFIMLGSELNKVQKKMIEQPNIPILILSAIATFFISTQYHLDMAWNNIIPIIPITFGALTGTFMIFILSSIIEKHFVRCSRMLQAIGRETYIILAFSQIIIMCLNEFFSLNAILKYLILILTLIVLKHVKDHINRFASFKLL